MRPDFQAQTRRSQGRETSLPRRLFAIEPKGKLRRGNVVQCCSKHSRLFLAERALETALGFLPKRDRLGGSPTRSEEHTSELQSHLNLVCRLLLEKKKKSNNVLSVDLS